MKLPLAMALALTTASAAIAQETTVQYLDLDLSRVEGQRELERRIDAATRRVCSATPATGTRIASRRAQQRCKAEVRAQIESQMPR